MRTEVLSSVPNREEPSILNNKLDIYIEMLDNLFDKVDKNDTILMAYFHKFEGMSKKHMGMKIRRFSNSVRAKFE
jgi:hypothetical protein